MRLVGASDAVRPLAVHLRGPARRPHRRARDARPAGSSRRRRSAELADAIAGQVPGRLQSPARSRRWWPSSCSPRASASAASAPRSRCAPTCATDPAFTGTSVRFDPTVSTSPDEHAAFRRLHVRLRPRPALTSDASAFPTGPDRRPRPAWATVPTGPVRPVRRRIADGTEVVAGTALRGALHRRLAGRRGAVRVRVHARRPAIGHARHDGREPGALRALLGRVEQGHHASTWARSSRARSSKAPSRACSRRSAIPTRLHDLRGVPGEPVGHLRRVRGRRRRDDGPGQRGRGVRRRIGETCQLDRRRASCAARRPRPPVCWRATCSSRSTARRSTGMTVDEVVAKVRGPKGTTVVLGLERDGTSVELTHHARRHPARGREQLRSSPTARSATSRSTGSAPARPTTSRPAAGAARRQGLEALRPRPARRPGRLRRRRARRSPASSSPTGPLYWEEYADGRPGAADAPRPAASPRTRRSSVVVLVNGGTASRQRDRRRGAAGHRARDARRRDDVRQGHHPAVAPAARRQRRLPALGRQVADARPDLDPRRRHRRPTSWSTGARTAITQPTTGLPSLDRAVQVLGRLSPPGTRHRATVRLRARRGGLSDALPLPSWLSLARRTKGGDVQ